MEKNVNKKSMYKLFQYKYFPLMNRVCLNYVETTFLCFIFKYMANIDISNQRRNGNK